MWADKGLDCRIFKKRQKIWEQRSLFHTPFYLRVRRWCYEFYLRDALKWIYQFKCWHWATSATFNKEMNRDGSSPDSLVKSFNSMSWVKQNSINFMECCLWQIPNYLDLVLNSAQFNTKFFLSFFVFHTLCPCFPVIYVFICTYSRGLKAIFYILYNIITLFINTLFL